MTIAQIPMRLSTAIVSIFQDVESGGYIDKVLRAARTHLEMDVAFVAEFQGDKRVLRHLDACYPTPLYPGQVIPPDSRYVREVISGHLATLVADATANAAYARLSDTDPPLGAHLSVPIWLADGTLYGTLCCLRYQADPTLGDRDTAILKTLSELVAHRLDQERTAWRRMQDKAARIDAAIMDKQPRIVYQPIYDVEAGTVAGVECLSRFYKGQRATPAEWFKEAVDAGLGPSLEQWAMEKALAGMAKMPSHVFFAINASREFISSGLLEQTLEGQDLTRLVLEVTERAAVANDNTVLDRLQPLRQRCLRIALDNAGAGHASMRDILHLRPDQIKLDISLVHGIDMDASHRALAAALSTFAHDIGSDVVAEGVETPAEWQVLRGMGVDHAQGYLLSHPVPLEDAVGMVHAPRVQVDRPAPDDAADRRTAS